MTETVLKIVEKHKGSSGGLIAILGEIQQKYGYLPEEALRMLALQTGRSLVEIYGVATFYRFFRLKPRGKHLISACVGTACHVRGAPQIAEELQRRLKVNSGETTADGEFTFETVNCLGACALGPIVVVDGHYFSNVSTKKVKQIIEKAREGLDKVEVGFDERLFPLEVSCPRCNHSLMDHKYGIDGFPSIKVTVSCEHEHGWLRLSSLYGSYNVESEFEIPPDTVVNFFCPYCHAEIIGSADCPECGAKMAPMIVRGGGMIQICSRRGCKGHMLDLNGENF